MPGVPSVAGDSTAAGTPLSECRQWLAESLGFWLRGTVTTVASSLEADRYVVSDNVKSDSLPPAHWDGLWLSVTSGDEQGSARRLMNGTFDGTDGVFRVDAAFDSGPLAEGTTFEIGVLPVVSAQGLSGFNRILNLALNELPVIDAVSLTLVSEQVNYSLINYSWPIKRISKVYYARTSTTTERRVELSRGSWDFENDAEAPILSFRDLPFADGDTIEVELYRPANTRVRQNGAWGDTRVGLVDDDDETLYDALTLGRKARPIALERMALAYDLLAKERIKLELDADRERTAAALARFYSQFRGSGAQSAGARWGQSDRWERWGR